MSKNPIFKLLLDLILLAVYVLLCHIDTTGLLRHEILGLIVCALFILHVAVNIQMIRGLAKKKTLGTVIGLVLDGFLGLAILVVGVSGVLISKELFSGMPGSDVLTLMHKISAKIGFLLILTHLVLHAKYIATVSKAFPTLIRKGHFGRACAMIAAVLLCCVFAFSTINMTNRLQTVLNADSQANSESFSENRRGPQMQLDRRREENQEFSDSSDNSQQIEEDSESSGSLEDYLAGLTCSGCGKRCSLLNPRCGKGETQAQQAAQNYNQNL